MPTFILITRIHAPVEICFDLARSIDLHLETMKSTGEKAIAGVTSGLIGHGETVTWRARHFGVQMELTSKITECSFPNVFTDEMVKGPFKKLLHKHVFEVKDGLTLMVDEFSFESPFGLIGKLVDCLFLKMYMQKLIMHRNEVIKRRAELTTLKQYQHEK